MKPGALAAMSKNDERKVRPRWLIGNPFSDGSQIGRPQKQYLPCRESELSRSKVIAFVFGEDARSSSRSLLI